MPPLATNAIRLLEALTAAQAYAPARALTDRQLAEACSLPARAIIDAAGELLDVGYLVVASCGTPPGRWLFSRVHSDPADLRHARAYLQSLNRRAMRILHRRRTVRDSLRRLDQLEHHQGRLFA